MLFAAIGTLGGRGASKFTSPKNPGVFEQTACFEIHQEGGNGLVHCGEPFGEFIGFGASAG